MEVAARLGGGHDAELVRAVTGIDLAALAVAFALGETASVDNVLDAIVGTRLEHETGACVRFLVAPKGTLRAIEGVVRAEQLPGIEWVRIYRREGDTIGPLRSGADRAGAILAIGSTRGDALERADGAATLVDFVVDA
jgi:biotin carboxylase